MFCHTPDQRAPIRATIPTCPPHLMHTRQQRVGGWINSCHTPCLQGGTTSWGRSPRAHEGSRACGGPVGLPPPPHTTPNSVATSCPTSPTPVSTFLPTLPPTTIGGRKGGRGSDGNGQPMPAGCHPTSFHGGAAGSRHDWRVIGPPVPCPIRACGKG